MQDRSLTCRDCQNAFVFTAGEQEFYASKGLQNDPVRCPDCRNARKSARNTLENDSGYIRYGGAASFGGRTPRQMHPAACALCGDMIEVPFIPRGDRPVFCSAVKRLMTHGMQLEEVANKWGQRPCQNNDAREFLRNAPPPPREGEPREGATTGGFGGGGFGGGLWRGVRRRTARPRAGIRRPGPGPAGRRATELAARAGDRAPHVERGGAASVAAAGRPTGRARH